MATKADFINWKLDPITEAVMSGFLNRIRDLEIQLGASAGIDPLEDRFRVGAIAAYRDILDISVEETLDE